MKKNRRYRRSFSQLNKFITQAKVTEFTDDQDIILELDDKKKRQALYIPSNKDPVLKLGDNILCLLYTSPSPRDGLLSRMPSSA